MAEKGDNCWKNGKCRVYCKAPSTIHGTCEAVHEYIYILPFNSFGSFICLIFHLYIYPQSPCSFHLDSSSFRKHSFLSCQTFFEQMMGISDLYYTLVYKKWSIIQEWCLLVLQEKASCPGPAVSRWGHTQFSPYLVQIQKLVGDTQGPWVEARKGNNQESFIHLGLCMSKTHIMLNYWKLGIGGFKI